MSSFRMLGLLSSVSSSVDPVGGLAEGVHDLVEAGAEHELAAVIHQVQPGEAAAVQVLLVELLHHLVEGAGVVPGQVAGGAQLLLLGLLRRGLASVGRRGLLRGTQPAPAGT